MNKVMNTFSTFRAMCACAVFILLCACNTNAPSDDICAPVTKAQRAAIEKAFADNHDCLVQWLNGNSGDVLELASIYAAQQNDADEVDDDLYSCFPDTYTTHEFDETGTYIVHSTLKQRVYIVYAWSKWKYISDAELRDLEASGRANEQLYFDAQFNLIPCGYNCECDCWISNK